MKPLLLLAALCMALTGCGVTHHARPIGKGNHAVAVSVGGPVAGIGDPDTFVPEVTATYKYGVTDRADVFVGWHVLETFINNGNLFFDIGASYYFLDQKGPLPGISGAFTVSPLINSKGGWAMFDLTATASWALGPRERHLIYVGVNNVFLPVRGQLVETATYILSPFVGGQLRVGKKREIGLGLEVKWHRPWANTTDSIVGFIGPGDQGALAFMGGIQIFIGKDMKPAPPPIEELPPPDEEPPAEEPAPAAETPPAEPTEEAPPAEPEPEAAEPEAAEPEAAEPEAAEPEAAEPEAADPEPEAAEPVEPDAPEPAPAPEEDPS